MSFRRKRRGGSQGKKTLRSSTIIAKQREVTIVEREGGRFRRISPELVKITNPNGSVCIVRSVGGIGDVLSSKRALSKLNNYGCLRKA